MSDKAGTLTHNGIIIFIILLCHDGLLGIEMKKLHMGTMLYSFDSMDEVTSSIGCHIRVFR